MSNVKFSLLRDWGREGVTTQRWVAILGNMSKRLEHTGIEHSKNL